MLVQLQSRRRTGVAQSERRVFGSHTSFALAGRRAIVIRDPEVVGSLPTACSSLGVAQESERVVGDHEVAGAIPVTQTKQCRPTK